MQQLEHHWIPIYDNLSSLPGWFSDALCSAVTGAGQESRALYTDDDVVIRSFRRCIMFNGINLPAQKGDLLDRTVLYETVPDAEKRRTEEELKAKYEQERPAMLGGFLDVLVKAIRIKDTVQPEKLFRLADFTRWGCALSEALGYPQTEFMKALKCNLKSQNDETVHASPVASAFIAYCNEKLTGYDIDHQYVNTPTNVFRDVEEMAQTMLINTKTKDWPRGTQPFTRKLKGVQDAITAFGWNYDIIPNGATRDMHIWTTTQPKKQPTQETIVTSQKPKRLCKDECKNWHNIDNCPL